MFPIAGIAYEFQRAAAKDPKNFWVRLFVSPGMLMQRLTTREPTDDQLEIALAALRKTMWREAQQTRVLDGHDMLESYADFVRVKEALVV
jgi:uncharacterized protein YqhQ